MAVQAVESYSLNPARMQTAEYARTVHVIDLEQLVDLAHVSKPEFWAHVATKLKPWDKIEVRAMDGTWYAELLVTDCSRTWAKVTTLSYQALGTSDQAQTMVEMRDALAKGLEKYELKHRGAKGWSVVNRANGDVLFEGAPSKDTATLQLAAWQRDQAPA